MTQGWLDKLKGRNSLAARLPVKKWVTKVNALPQRDRIALLAGSLALILGVEFQVIMPVHDRRVALLLSQPGLDPLEQQTAAQELQRKQDELAKLQQQVSHRAPIRDYTVQGAAPREVFASLRKAMALQEVEVVSLKALPDEAPVKPPMPSSAASASDGGDQAAAADPAASDAGAAAPVTAMPPKANEASVFRHRAELRIAGSLDHINAVLKQFEQSNQLLRLEKVKITPAEQDPKSIEATLSLVLISQEQQWLAM
ncbi:MAG: hypothetical protein KGN37_00775 [Burkholderiales bacterium]|nr:hypothetical protein [Burkholderiales bacterium]MDE2431366.1 hypothetical protein [Burkholderiales bacterium]